LGKKAIDLTAAPCTMPPYPIPVAPSLFDGLNFDKVAPMAELIMAKSSPPATTTASMLVYNKFKNAAVQIVTRGAIPAHRCRRRR
jgi:hypothetical protein